LLCIDDFVVLNVLGFIYPREGAIFAEEVLAVRYEIVKTVGGSEGSAQDELAQ